MPQRKALVIGINYYENNPRLYGCVNDAEAVARVLRRHGNDDPNFGVRLMTAETGVDALNLDEVRDAIEKLFSDTRSGDIALLYFAGHGRIGPAGGYLLTSECRGANCGLPLGDVVMHANDSRASSRIIILDSCHSGIAGAPPRDDKSVTITEGVTLLTGSTAEQYASEKNGAGIFTPLLVDALNGGAANLLGEISPGSVYAHIDQSLGEWSQRPVFKANVHAFISLRSVTPALARADLRRIGTLFPTDGHDFKLDPTFEPDMIGRSPAAPAPKEENVEKYKVLQKYNRVNLVVPVDAPHMWHAAMESKSCRLTKLGAHYRQLCEKGHI